MLLDVDIATRIHVKDDGPKKRFATSLSYDYNGFSTSVYLSS